LHRIVKRCIIKIKKKGGMMSVLMESSYFTLQQVAERLQVSEMTVRRWVRRGELPAIKLGQQWRIRDDDLRDFLEARRVAGSGGVNHA
jgi:excisionase family DNA binding protein